MKHVIYRDSNYAQLKKKIKMLCLLNNIINFDLILKIENQIKKWLSSIEVTECQLVGCKYL
jgi:hypothetical protein